MVGPLTIEVGKTYDGFIRMLGYDMVSKAATGQNNIEVEILEVPLFQAAHAVYKGRNFQPNILWGNFWFLYYQAWLWKCSKRWRENVVEAWLKRLRDKGELGKLLAQYYIKD